MSEAPLLSVQDLSVAFSQGGGQSVAVDHISFDIADFLARPEMSFLSKSYNTVAMGALLYACGGRRFRTHGLEHLEGMDSKSSVLFVWIGIRPT